MNKKHGTPPDPDKQPLLFGDTPEQRGMLARLKAERGGDPFAAFVEWFIQANPQWAANAAHEITRAAVVSLRDLLGVAPAGWQTFSMRCAQFRFPVDEEPPFLPRAYRNRGLAEAEHEPEQTTGEVAFSIRRMIAKKKEEEAARRASGAAPDITPEPGLPDWRWILFLREKCTAYSDSGEGMPPAPETLALWKLPVDEGKETQRAKDCAFRIETMKAIAASNPEGDFPGFDSPEAREGKELLDRLFPSDPSAVNDPLRHPRITLARLPVFVAENEGEGTPLAFNITIEIAPLTFDFFGADNGFHPSTYFPLFIRCEEGEGAPIWEEISTDRKAAIFQRLLSDLEAKITPEDWNFPGSIEHVESSKEKAKGQRKRIPPGAPKYSLPALDLFQWASEKEFHSQSSATVEHITSTSKELDKVSPGTLKEYKEKFQSDPKGIGFSLRDDRLDAFTGISKLYAKYKPANGRFIIEREEYLVATGLEKILHSDGKWQFPADQARRRIDGLSQLALTPGIIGITEPDEENPGRFKYSQFIGTMISIVRVWDNLSAQEAREIEAGATEIDLSKIKRIEVQLFTSLWEIREKNKVTGAGGTRHFFMPTNFEQRLREAELKACVRGKTSQARKLFLYWVQKEGARQLFLAKKYPRTNKPRLEASYQELAERMQLHPELSSGRRSRGLREIEKAIRVAFHMGLISKPVGNSDKKRTHFAFDLKDGTIWREIEEWKKRRDDLLGKDAIKEDQAAAENPVEKETERAAEIAAFRKGRLEKLATIEKGIRLPRGNPDHVFPSKLEALISETETELGNSRHDKEVADVLREVLNRAKEIRLGAMKPKRAKPTQKATPASPPAPEEPPPPCDPAAEKAWKPIIAAILPQVADSRREQISSAIPTQIEDRRDRNLGKRIILWFPGWHPSLFSDCGIIIAKAGKRAGFGLAWTGPADPYPKDID